MLTWLPVYPAPPRSDPRRVVDPKEQIRQLVEDNFAMWGPIKRLYMVHLKTLAFVE